MIDGMEMDAAERMRAPPLAELVRYCRCVAGAVGMLSIRVFGAHSADAERGAVALGEALQLTNILRDLHEDAERGRLYLPGEWLVEQGLAAAAPQAMLAEPDLAPVLARLAERARGCFDAADRHFATVDRRRLRPALVMCAIYRRTLDRLMARGWRRLDQEVRVPKSERLWLAVRHGVL